MKIIYFYRNSQVGYSIAKVFHTITDEIKKSQDIEEYYMPSARATFSAIIRNMLFAYRHRNKNGINHITGEIHYIAWVLPPKSTVITVHDIMYYNYQTGVKKKIWKYLYIQSLSRASLVVFISEQSKNIVLNEINISPEKIRVIPNPVSQEMKLNKKNFNSSKPIILHIGTLGRKNLMRTIEAISGLSCHLRIIGKLNIGIVQQLEKYRIEYSYAERLTDQEIIDEYISCDIVNFPSLLEGFGMPIVEGQSIGRVVITSNISPMKEVAGNGACLVDPKDINSIREAYIKVINEEPYRHEIIKNGMNNAKKYRVDNIAQQYLYIYQIFMQEK